MRNLLNFIIRYSRWFVFTLYVLLSLLLLVSNNAYQQSVYLTSANVVTGGVYSVWQQVTGYFHLRSINESLQTRNAALQNEVLNLQHEVTELRGLLSDTLGIDYKGQDRFDYVPAVVINNDTRHPRNYFTINRGHLDGVRPGMGVADQSGVVGIVNVVDNHMARVISLLNETQHFSVKMKDTNYVGSLSWKGKDPTIAYVEEMPRHAIYQPGDTVVTSGYSTTFPEGLPVGVILNRVKGDDDSFFTFKVRLITDFRALSAVRVIKDIYKQQIDSLAKFDIVTDK